MVKTGRIPHVQLYVGEKGGGNLALALAFATYLHCSNRQQEDACEVCASCVKMSRLVHPDMHLVFPASSLHATQQKGAGYSDMLAKWRKFITQNPYGDLGDWSHALGDGVKGLQIHAWQARGIKQELYTKPFEGAFRTILVWLPEYLNSVGANSLLKVLEEPAGQSFFLFVTGDITKLLPTLQSRMWPIYLPLFTDAEVLSGLQTRYTEEDTTHLRRVAEQSQGSLGEALQRMEQHEESEHFAGFSQWLRSGFVADWGKLTERAEQLHATSLAAQMGWIRYGIQLLRKSLLSRFSEKFLTGLEKQEEDFCKKFNQAVSEKALVQILALLRELEELLPRHVYAKLAFLNLSIQLVRLFKK